MSTSSDITVPSGYLGSDENFSVVPQNMRELLLERHMRQHASKNKNYLNLLKQTTIGCTTNSSFLKFINIRFCNNSNS
jgi:hypothetical protein